MKNLRKMCSAIVILAMLVGFLPVGVQSASAAEGTYNINSGSVTITEGGTYTINGSGTATTNTITVNSGVTATITLNNVTIDLSSTTGTAFDIQSGANVTLILEGTNTLTSGTVNNQNGAPGIHLPARASLTIQSTTTSGSLTVTGGGGSLRGGAGIGGGVDEGCGAVTINSGTVKVNGGASTNGGAGIGGGVGYGSANGGAGGTVVILAPGVTVQGGSGNTANGTDIGGGLGSSGTKGDDGDGIRPNTGGNNTYEVYGDLTLPGDIEIPSGVTVIIPNDASLIVPSGTTLTNNGTITGGGDFTVEGDVEGSGNSTVTGTVDKKAQTATAPTLSGEAGTTSVTITSVSGQAYAYTTDNSQPSTDATTTWTPATGNTLTFSNLNAGDTYYIWTYRPGNAYYDDSPLAGPLTVHTKPEITTTSLSPATVNSAYSAELTATSQDSVSWSITSGELPNGLSLNGNTISGTPTAVTSSPVSITVQASTANTSSTQQLTLTVQVANPDFGTLSVTGGTGTGGAFVYGDTITVSGTIATSTTAPGTSTNAITQNQVGLYVDETELATASVDGDGSFTLTYDTSKKGIEATGQSQDLTVRYGGSSTLTSGSTTVSITLNKKSVTAQVQGDINKVYDGDTSATVTLGFADGAILTSDTVTVSVPDAVYASAEVGDNISINLGTLTVEGSDAVWYSVSAPTGVTGSITQSGSELTATPSSTNLTYGDTLTITVTPSSTGQSPANNALTPQTDGNNTVELYNGHNLLVGTSEKNDDGTYTLTYNTTGKGLSIGSNTLTVKFNGDTNMAASSTTVQVTLNTKAVTASVSGTPEKTYDGESDVDVSLTFADGVLVGSDSFIGTVSGNFDNANVGMGKSITLSSSPVWTDTDTAGFYNISLPTDVTGIITMAAISNRPVITGSAIPGSTLTASYTPVTGETVSFPWNLDGSPISGAAGNTYMVRETDVGHKLTVTATATDGNHTGSMTSDAVTAGKASQDAPGPNEGYTIDYRAETITADEGYELAETDTASSGSASLTAIPGGTVYVRLAETSSHNPSPWTTVDIPSRPAAPQNVRGGTNSITNVNSTMAYSVDGETWTAITGNRVTNLRAGSYLVRFQATDSVFASESVSVTVSNYVAPPSTPSEPEPSGPSTGDSDGWTSITDELGKLNPDTQEEPLTIEMNGETEVPKEVFETIAGKDVDVVFDMGDGVSWSVNGADIPADANLSNLDLGVSMNTDGIPVDVINAITGEAASVQITLAYDGDFGFALTLSAPLGEENAGYWANLYHYNEDGERMDFETAALIDDDGTANLRMTHASQYAIVIDDHPHETVLPFTDVNANDWFYDPVVWAYDNGLMTGTSPTTFEPNTSTTRAMIVAILNRLEDGPTADGGTFTDVADGDWYAEAVNWAASVGIVAGFEDGSFRPNAPITREQMAAILYNYAQWKGYDVSNRADLSRYSDQPSAWANDVMQWAVGEGLISGTSATTLDPQGSATRAQVASILQRFLAD